MPQVCPLSLSLKATPIASFIVAADLYQDLFIVFILALTLGNTPSSRTLTVKRPSANLLSLYNLLLSCGFITLTFGLQAWAFYAVEEQPWYDSEEYPASMDPELDEEGTNSVIPTTTSVSDAVRPQCTCYDMSDEGSALQDSHSTALCIAPSPPLASPSLPPTLPIPCRCS